MPACFQLFFLTYLFISWKVVALYWCRQKKTKFRDSMGRIILVYLEKSYALILFKIFLNSVVEVKFSSWQKTHPK